MKSSQNYIHNNKASLLSRVFHFFMWLLKTNKLIEKSLTKGKINQSAAPIPNSIKETYDVREEILLSRKIWTIKPKNSSPKKTIIYMHGGAYIFNISKYHWEFISEILSKTNSRIIVVDYPLAPNNNYKDIYKLMDIVYSNTLSNIPAKEVIFLGDSAGAGFLLSFSQHLRNNNLEQAYKVILLSPWLDLSMSNNKSSLNKDVVLSIKGLQLAAKSIAGDLPLNDPKISPLFDDFDNLASIYIFIAGNELFYPDIIELKNKAASNKSNISYFEYPDMFHDWAIFTYLEESKIAIEQVSAIINN